MNKAILQDEVQNFITTNINSDINTLILKGSPFETISIQELANQIQAKKKAKEKLPTWFNAATIYYPAKISIEQTSSEITAKYKASLFNKKEKFIDLTAGFGVDSYYFAKEFKQGLHCEINEELSAIVQYNYAVLAVKNIQVEAQNGLAYLQETKEKFDLIFIDPSRRHSQKGKVFLLEDYEPNVIANLELLLSKGTAVLIKVSPLLDITSVLKSLKNVREVHCVAVNNEMKELLFLLDSNNTKSVQIKTINLTKKGEMRFDFDWNEQYEASYALPKKQLYEPNSALLKSGAFAAVSARYGIDKLHKHTHLYTSDKFIDFPGRRFEITAVFSPNKKEIKRYLPAGKANVTVRNYPNDVAAIRKKFKLKDGGEDYLFFCTDMNNNKMAILAKKC